ncbi:Putative cell wall binding repeat 2 [Rathayibacter oskolensis]|uniref:Putative cell wall binding repeat 2 n=1 Tax=Rathayibacter oskolensis TaxID=1891671 RepID=A0A1X7NVV4_9MICO|nr:cell wall-binding repeat-containing protein [Rathayibacter oskolensis]SMH41993.1 Putative cell wall binding repeat 2 [Rathayibacter oskolensis]
MNRSVLSRWIAALVVVATTVVATPARAEPSNLNPDGSALTIAEYTTSDYGDRVIVDFEATLDTADVSGWVRYELLDPDGSSHGPRIETEIRSDRHVSQDWSGLAPGTYTVLFWQIPRAVDEPFAPAVRTQAVVSEGSLTTWRIIDLSASGGDEELYGGFTFALADGARPEGDVVLRGHQIDPRDPTATIEVFEQRYTRPGYHEFTMPAPWPGDVFITATSTLVGSDRYGRPVEYVGERLPPFVNNFSGASSSRPLELCVTVFAQGLDSIGTYSVDILLDGVLVDTLPGLESTTYSEQCYPSDGGEVHVEAIGRWEGADGFGVVAPRSYPLIDQVVTVATEVAVERLAGVDRQGTAVAISRATFAPDVPVVYIATGERFADALSAAPAAARQGGPLLLVDRDSMSQPVRDELARLTPDRIVVVGSSASVSDALLRELRAYSGTVQRIGGVDRYDTADKIVRDAFPNGWSTAWLATGEKFPDALSAAAAAGSLDAPVLLVNGGLATADSRTRRLVADLGVTSVTIAGSALSVSDGIARSLPVRSTRIGGVDRYDTSERLMSAAFTSASTVYLATGEDFPDALAGATAAGYTDSPLYAVQPDCVPTAVLDDIAELRPSTVVLLGGTGTLSDRVARLEPCT